MSALRMMMCRLLLVCLGICLPLAVIAGPYSALVVDVESERVLYEQDAHASRHPASLTKMMTLYLVFEALEQGKLSLGDHLRASHYASTRAPSKMGLRPGESISVEQGILALVTQSANDAATTLAEGIAGSEPAFAARMTEKAHQLGMLHSHFNNASGLPDPDQVTTAWDMYRLGRALIKHFPQYYSYFSTEQFQYKKRQFHNHNHLLENFEGTDGIKTGFVNASGFNLVASAKRNGHRLIGVVFGGNSWAQRDAHMRHILDDGFSQMEGQPTRLHLEGFDRWGSPLMTHKGDMDHAHTLDALSGLPSGRGRKLQADAAKPRESMPLKYWQVHLGNFRQAQQAQSHVLRAQKILGHHLHGAQAHVAPIRGAGQGAHRIQSFSVSFQGVNQSDARLLCQALQRERMSCTVRPHR